VNEFNRGTNVPFDLPAGVLQTVAVVSPTPGIYNVEATAAWFANVGTLACNLAAYKSGASKYLDTSGYATSGNTLTVDGAMVISSGSVIRERCVANGSGTVWPTITAVQVTHATGTVTAGPLSHQTQRLRHQFVNPLKRVPRPRVLKTRTTT
jgi:hypothetical protein